MTDTTISVIVGGIVTIVVTAIQSWNNRKAIISKVVEGNTTATKVEGKLAGVEEKVTKVDDKLDKSIEQSNGHMAKLLETTEELGKKIGAAEQKEKNGMTDQDKK